MIEPVVLLAVIAVIIVLLFDYTNGFHDAANIVATVIASRAMTSAQAVIIVGILVGTYSSIYIASALALDFGLKAEHVFPSERRRKIDDLP